MPIQDRQESIYIPAHTWAKIMITIVTLHSICLVGAVAFVNNFRHEPNAIGTIIFVHGLFGDKTSTWTNKENGSYFPNLVAQDPAFNHWNIYVADLPSPKIEESLSIDELADALRLDLESSDILPGQDLVFVSHSMGGIVTRAFLTKYRDYAPHVRLLYFFSTPTLGADVAKWGRLMVQLFVSRNPQIADLEPITSGSYLMTRLSDWLAAKFTFPSYCAYETKDTLGLRIVNVGSATALATERVDPIDEDHISIVQPRNSEVRSYRAFKSAFLRTIDGNPTNFKSLGVSAVIRFAIKLDAVPPDKIPIVAAAKLEDQYGNELAFGKELPSTNDPLAAEEYWNANAVLKHGVYGASGVTKGESLYEINLRHFYIPDREEAFSGGTLNRLAKIEFVVRGHFFHALNQSAEDKNISEWFQNQSLIPKTDGELSLIGIYGTENSIELINTGYTENVWEVPSLRHATDVRVEPTGKYGFVEIFSRFRDYPSFIHFAR